jgi:hypothetical protein
MVAWLLEAAAPICVQHGERVLNHISPIPGKDQNSKYDFY